MQLVKQMVRPFVGNRRGQGLIEYVLIVTLVGCCLVAILGLASTTTRNMYSRTTATINRTTSTGYGSGGGGAGLGGWSGSGVGTAPAEPHHPHDPPPDGDPSDSSEVSVES
jgi:Flp pilus assembly pilin Flp